MLEKPWNLHIILFLSLSLHLSIFFLYASMFLSLSLCAFMPISTSLSLSLPLFESLFYFSIFLYVYFYLSLSLILFLSISFSLSICLSLYTSLVYLISFHLFLSLKTWPTTKHKIPSLTKEGNGYTWQCIPYGIYKGPKNTIWSIKHIVYTYTDTPYVHHNMIFIPLKRSH